MTARCLVGTCGVRVMHGLPRVMCLPHWRRLTGTTRHALWRTFWSARDTLFRDAVTQAVESLGASA